MTAMASGEWGKHVVAAPAPMVHANEPVRLRAFDATEFAGPIATRRTHRASTSPRPAALDLQNDSAAARVGFAQRFYLAYAKRSFDIVLAAVLFVLILPILIAASVWITLDARANPFFLQRRVGRGGKGFTLVKLRTMEPSSEDGLVWLIDEHGVRRHKFRNDPRITRPGRFLRRTSIDELPQLWNVLRGDMSLIGPRPELPEIVAAYQPWQNERHTVRPGLTGWWQVSGRSDRPMHEHTDLDIYYVERVSPKLDVLIAFKTIRVVLKGLGAF